MVCLCVCLVLPQGFPVHLPTFVARMLAFKLSVDTSKLPAVGDLMRSMARWVGGVVCGGMFVWMCVVQSDIMSQHA